MNIIAIIVFAIGLLMLTLWRFNRNTPEKKLVAQFYFETYQVQDHLSHVHRLKSWAQDDFIRWVAGNKIPIAQLQDVLCRPSMELLDELTKDDITGVEGFLPYIVYLRNLKTRVSTDQIK